MHSIHPNARTTPAVRREIALSSERTGVLAQRYGVSTETIRIWRKRGPEACLDRSARPPRGSEFARAFEGERALEVDCRELAGLLGSSARLPLLPRLTAESAEHRGWLRRLYLRYS